MNGTDRTLGRGAVVVLAVAVVYVYAGAAYDSAPVMLAGIAFTIIGTALAGIAARAFGRGGGR